MRSLNILLSLLAATTLEFSGRIQRAQAQVISDGTTATFVDSISSPFISGHAVLGGNAEGENLFHSFSQLNTSDGAFINFIVDPSITANVISRVTDSGIHLNGAVTVTTQASNGLSLAPNTNLFLFSPHGVRLGSNFVTNIDGAFVGSSASAMTFEDGKIFSSDIAAPPTLTISTPTGLQFNNSAADIQVEGINSTVSTVGFNTLGRGQNVLLVGGDINASGNINLAAGRIQFAGLSERGTVLLDSSNAFLQAALPTDRARANVSFTNGALVVANGPIESISVDAHDILLDEQSSLLSGAFKDLSLPFRSGDINIDATGKLQLANSNIYNGIDVEAAGSTGNVNINTSSLYLTDTAQIGSVNRGTGDIGNANISASSEIVLSGNNSLRGTTTGLYSILGDFEVPDVSGQPGNLIIKTPRLSILNGALISASTLGEGDAGNISIEAKRILVDGASDTLGLSSSISSSVEYTARGNGGNVDIKATALTLDNGGAIIGRTQGQGDAGAISLSLDTLDILNGAQVVTTSFTAGAAGDISINARDRLFIAGSDPTYEDRVAISLFNALGSSSSGVYANTDAISSGAGGSIQISTANLSLADAAQISVSSLGTGAAGNAEVSASEGIRLSNSTIQAESRGGSEGNLTLAAPILVLSDRSQITTNATGAATGGNINLRVPLVIGANNSDIVARATQGAGGNINIETSGLFGIAVRPTLTPSSDINASSELNADGTVAISTPEVDPDNGLVALPENLVDPSDSLTAGCSTEQNQFVASGRGGLSPNPTQLLSNHRPWSDLRSTRAQQSNVLPRTVSQDKQQNLESTAAIREAAAWSRNEAQEIVLLDNSHALYSSQPASCLRIQATKNL